MINISQYIERKFRRMKPSEQRFINAAREEKIFWRGEDIADFKQVYEETQKMRSIGAKRYKAEATAKLKALITGKGSFQ